MSARHEDSWIAHLADLTSAILPRLTYSRDPTYYFRDGSVLLLVEGTLFKVGCSGDCRPAYPFESIPKP
jgi:hypothetical protein